MAKEFMEYFRAIHEKFPKFTCFPAREKFKGGAQPGFSGGTAMMP
jgi:hypothetical protein